ncbi:MAG: DUF4142 domain-containing protein [Janthinobacterium lividum]
MKNNICLMLIAAVLIGFFSCSSPGKNTAADSTSLQNASAKQAIDTADTRLANDLSIFCTSQVQAAQLAQAKASTQKVKKFAKENEEIYKKLDVSLNRISENYMVSLPAPSSATATKNIQDLKAIKGASLDHAYLLQMLKDHNRMIREINAAKHIQCVPVKMFVVSYQSTIIRQAYALSDLKEQTP